MPLPSVADPGPGSGASVTPGSGIRNRFFPDPGFYNIENWPKFYLFFSISKIK
jgi:hypothetical protein